jgi:hypothetical protein
MQTPETAQRTAGTRDKGGNAKDKGDNNPFSPTDLIVCEHNFLSSRKMKLKFNTVLLY